MPWMTRGLREGIVTTRYPHRPDGYGPGYHGAIRVLDTPPPSGVAGPSPSDVEALCPTGAIHHSDGRLRVDRGACILCGRCVERHPERFAFDATVEVASRERRGVVVPDTVEDDAAIAGTRAALDARVRTLRRSVHIRHVDAGSDGSEEWEVGALNNPVYDVQRLGIFFTASPRHADLLLVTGAGSAGMARPLRTTWEAMPDPKVVVAAGTDASSGGLVDPSYATRGGVGAIVPVDVWVPGSPPSPFALLHGILLALGLLPTGPRR